MKNAVLFLEPKGTIFEIARVAKSSGYEPIALVSDPSLISNAPDAYRESANLIRTISPISSWRDQSEVDAAFHALSEKFNIKGIYSGVDPCAVSAARLRKRLGLPTTNPDALETVLDKRRLRLSLRDAGLSDLRSYSSEQMEQMTDWPFPRSAYFKPLHGFFSAYVQKCDSLEDFRKAKSRWETGVDRETPFVRNYLKSNSGYHVEEAIEGELLSVESISSSGEFHSIGLLSRILFSKNPIVEMGSVFPYPHRFEEQIVERVRRAHSIFGLSDGPSHTEVIVSSDGRIEVIDLNPRFVGADVLQSINNAYGITIEKSLLEFAVGKCEIPNRTRSEFACLQYVLPPSISTFNSISFPDSLAIKFKATFLSPGTKVESYEKQLDYLGCYLTVMPTFDEASALSKRLRADVRVNVDFGGVF